MDPDCALKMLLTGLQDRDVIVIEEVARGLLHWLDQGGFPPKTIGPWKLGQDWHATLTRQICTTALAVARRIARESTPPM